MPVEDWKSPRGDKPGKVPLFSVVLEASGEPWPEANIWLIWRAMSTERDISSTLASSAKDLADFRRFLEDAELDYLKFPQNQIYRPTYRYRANLSLRVESGEVKISTANRRLNTMVRFYRWLIEDEQVFMPSAPPWITKRTAVRFTARYGSTMVKELATTDMKVHARPSSSEFDGTIDDGGKLRPLPREEQEWLMLALIALNNYTMTLVHLVGILSGARIQSILTLRLGHVSTKRHVGVDGCVAIPAGPGTGIDTKDDKTITLWIPAWFYEMLQVYARSKSASKRRAKAFGGDNEQQYLFLSVKGAPFYRSKDDQAVSPSRRYREEGQAVRQFMSEKVTPYIRTHFSKSFSYRFHDTRATFGMNLVDSRIPLVNLPEGHPDRITLSRLLNYVMQRMSHESIDITERYLNFRKNIKLLREAQDEWEQHLVDLAKRAGR